MNSYPTHLQPTNTGDLLFRPKALGIVEHCGVSLGNGYVLHNSPERGEEVVPVTVFAAGQPVRVQATGQPPLAVLSRAQQVLANPRSWHGTDRNCEHTATEVVYGKPSSPQLVDIVVMSLAALGLAYFLTRRS